MPNGMYGGVRGGAYKLPLLDLIRIIMTIALLEITVAIKNIRCSFCLSVGAETT